LRPGAKALEGAFRALDLNQLKSWMRGDILVDRLKISRLDGR
jgi:hypothetical protein